MTRASKEHFIFLLVVVAACFQNERFWQKFFYISDITICENGHEKFLNGLISTIITPSKIVRYWFHSKKYFLLNISSEILQQIFPTNYFTIQEYSTITSHLQWLISPNTIVQLLEGKEIRIWLIKSMYFSNPFS